MRGGVNVWLGDGGGGLTFHMCECFCVRVCVCVFVCAGGRVFLCVFECVSCVCRVGVWGASLAGGHGGGGLTLNTHVRGFHAQKLRVGGMASARGVGGNSLIMACL